MARFDYEEMVLLRIIELNELVPHYFSNLMLLTDQLINDDERDQLSYMITDIEDYVFEKEDLNHEFYCRDCKKNWETRIEPLYVAKCPHCKSVKIVNIRMGKTFYDLELAMESNQDYNSYFKRYGKKISKFSLERRLNMIKKWVFALIRERASSRRFQRFK